MDARIVGLAKRAYDAVYTGETITVERPSFLAVEEEARRILQDAVVDGTWRARCKGRDLLKAYCGSINVKYEQFRNLVLSMINAPPVELAQILNVIMSESR